MLGAVWSILTLPFRLIGGAVATFGRLLGAISGFVLMVVGVAFCSSALYLIGLPVFVVGLILTLKCLG